MILKRAAIAALIPHRGPLCLLDEVREWDNQRLEAFCNPLAREDNPFIRPDGHLGTATLVEIAAQAMALHSCLQIADDIAAASKPGFLLTLRDLVLPAAIITNQELLSVTVLLSRSDDRSAIYDFSIEVSDRLLIKGRAMVVFGAIQ